MVMDRFYSMEAVSSMAGFISNKGPKIMYGGNHSSKRSKIITSIDSSKNGDSTVKCKAKYVDGILVIIDIERIAKEQV